MDFDPNAPAVVIGGPYHGLVYSCSGLLMKRYDPLNLDELLHRSEEYPAPRHIKEARTYRREFYTVDFGSLRLSGWVWMWEELEPKQLVSLVLGLMIAGLITK